MARTTANDVRKIVRVSASDDLAPFIKTANLLVTKVCVPRGYSEVTDADQLKEIEKYLTAHFYCVFKPRRKAEQAGKVMQTLDTKVGMGLQGTTYGQQAILLDTLGGLGAIDKAGGKVKIGIKWLGVDLCDPVGTYHEEP